MLLFTCSDVTLMQMVLQEIYKDQKTSFWLQKFKKFGWVRSGHPQGAGIPPEGEARSGGQVVKSGPTKNM